MNSSKIFSIYVFLSHYLEISLVAVVLRYFGFVPGKKEILRVLPFILSPVGPEASEVCSSVDALHPDESDVSFGEAALSIGFS